MEKYSSSKLVCIVFLLCVAVALDSPAQTMTVLHNFSGSDGANPAVELVLATDGNFYGTTYNGGPSGINAGTAFKITPSGNLTTLYNFCQQPPYCSDGMHPMRIIQGRDGNFYGVTAHGGTVNYTDSGFAYKLTPSGSETVLAQFCSLLHGCGFGPLVGSNPTSIMQATDGNFYGVDYNGGAGGGGAFWQLVVHTWALNLLFGFDSGRMGLYPIASLVQGRDGQLYGVTPHGGTGLPNCASYCGVVFKITLSGNETVLYNFCSQANCTDGATPSSALVQGSDGNFYGATLYGGTNGAGEIFKITPSGTLTVLHSLGGSDGSAIYAPLMQASDGNFYGTANSGGAHGYGTIFQITPSGVFTVLHNFNGSDGANSSSGLVEDSQGYFYGTTNNGGTSSLGVVFRFQPTYYPLTVSPTGNGSVTSTDGFISCPGTCSHSYLDNTQVTLNAIPAAGWYFSSWGGACSGSGLSCTVTMTQAQAVTATFAQSSYTLTVAPIGNGTITSRDGFIDCPGSCSHTYLSYTQVTLNATPGQGWFFGGWNGGCLGTGACTLTMTQSLTIDAIFSEALQFVAVIPCRLVDTRPDHGGSGPIQGGSSRDFPIPQEGGCDIPATAAAYSLNVTVIPGSPLGYLSVWPTGEDRPLVSTLNSLDGRIKANAAIVPAGTAGAVSVYVTQTANVILDINGYFAPISTSLAFYPLAPCRVADTRKSNFPQYLGMPHLSGGVQRDFPVLSSTCNIPTTAQAYSLNFTAVPYPALGDSLGYLEVWPKDQMPQHPVSTLNNIPGTIVANAAIVRAGTGGEITALGNNDTDLVIDINGYFAPAGQGGLSLYPTAPCRVIDTRKIGDKQPFVGTLNPPVDVKHSPCAPPATAQAYVFNATVVPVVGLGYLTLWPNDTQQPLTVSTLNAVDGWIASNMAIVPTNNGKVDAYASNLTQLVLDLSAYFAP